MAPTVSAPTPKNRPSSSVVSIFSDAYTNLSTVDYYPNWGQATQYNAYDLNGDAILQYANLNYQGIDWSGEMQDMTTKEFMHIDIWTADMTAVDIYPINDGVAFADEKFVTKTLTKDVWNSFDIPLTEFTDQGLPIDKIKQLKLVANGDSGTIFVDNIYFYKASEVKLPIRFNKEERFAGVGGAAVELSTDPTDSSNNTAKVTNGGNDWETAEIMLDVPISITSGGDNKYSVRIYSPDDAEHSLMMKLEESGDNEYIELRQPFQGAGWNTVHFDFSTITAQAWPNPGAAWDGMLISKN